MEVEFINDEGEKELRPYVANKYIKEYYKNQDNMTKELFEKGILSYELIAEATGLTRTIVENTITKTTKEPEIESRRMIHYFLIRLLSRVGEYNLKCMDCSRRRVANNNIIQMLLYVLIIRTKRKKNNKMKGGG